MNTTLSGLLTDVRPVPPGESILQANDRDTTLIEVVRPLLVDTRPIFARGDTPCKAIDEAVSSLIPGQLLVLVVDFKPSPSTPSWAIRVSATQQSNSVTEPGGWSSKENFEPRNHHAPRRIEHGSERFRRAESHRRRRLMNPSTTESTSSGQAASPLRVGEWAVAESTGAAHWLSDLMVLTKARANVAVVATTFVGFALHADVLPNWLLLFHALAGTALIAGSAAVANQAKEQQFDRRMVRTRNHPIAAGRLHPRTGMWLSGLLCGTGCLSLTASINVRAMVFAALAFVVYVSLYTPMKRLTPACTARRRRLRGAPASDWLGGDRRGVWPVGNGGLRGLVPLADASLSGDRVVASGGLSQRGVSCAFPRTINVGITRRVGRWPPPWPWWPFHLCPHSRIRLLPGTGRARWP